MITLLLKKKDRTVESKLVNLDDKLSFNFTASEFLINKNDYIDLACASECVVEDLQELRNKYGPIKITSAGRTPKYNAKEKGSSQSQHQYLFDCVDFIVYEATNEDVIVIVAYLIDKGYKGIGIYSSTTGIRFHIDRRNEIAIWDER